MNRELAMASMSGVRGVMNEFQRVLDADELADPGKTLVEVDGEMIALFHIGGEFFALDDVCTHDGGPLADGELVGHTIACPRHGAKFDVRSGGALTMPAVRATRAHRVKVADGGVWVAVGEPPASASIGGAAASSSSAPSTSAATEQSAASVSPSASAETPASTAAPAAPEPQPAAEVSGPLSEERVREMLKDVKDPELFVNIVDLGLIYGVTFTDAEEAGKQRVSVDMTMTSPACPAGPQLIADTKRVVSGHPEVADVEVRIVMDPPWTPERMTDEARDQLGIF